MRLRKILEKIVNLNPRMLPKYRHIAQKWWREPEEEYLLAEFGMKVYISMAIVLWVLASFGIIFAITSYLAKTTNGIIAWGFASTVLTIAGFSFFGSSNEQKRLYELEKDKYQNAISNKPTVERRMDTLCNVTEKNVREVLVNKLQSSTDLDTMIDVIEDLIILASDAQTSIKEIYRSNKVYDYNINEPLEAGAFQVVDSYSVCEILIGRLSEIVLWLYDCKSAASKGEEQIFAMSIDKVLNCLKANLDFDECEKDKKK